MWCYRGHTKAASLATIDAGEGSGLSGFVDRIELRALFLKKKLRVLVVGHDGRSFRKDGRTLTDGVFSESMRSVTSDRRPAGPTRFVQGPEFRSRWSCR